MNSAHELLAHYASIKRKFATVRVPQPVELPKLAEPISDDPKEKPFQGKAYKRLYRTAIGPKVPTWWHSRKMALTGPAQHRKIADDVCTKYSISLIGLLSERQDRQLVWARQEVMYRLATETTWGTTRIAQFVGKKCHTSVLHAIGAYQFRCGMPVTSERFRRTAEYQRWLKKAPGQ